MVWRDGTRRWCAVGSGWGARDGAPNPARRRARARRAGGRYDLALLVSAKQSNISDCCQAPTLATAGAAADADKGVEYGRSRAQGKGTRCVHRPDRQRRQLHRVLDADFSAWRVFFRGLKELSNDQTSALGELAAGGFLGRNDITMSNWGKSVKERSELFKEEFDRFIGLAEVRGALAKDLGMASQAPPASPLAAMRAAASREASPPRRTQGDTANDAARGTEHSPARAIDGGDEERRGPVIPNRLRRREPPRRRCPRR